MKEMAMKLKKMKREPEEMTMTKNQEVMAIELIKPDQLAETKKE